MMYKGYDFSVLSHDSVKIKDGFIMYIDPWEVSGEKADLILVTHEHFDHCSPSDIEDLLKPDGKVVASRNCSEKLEKFNPILLSTGESVSINGIVVHAVPAYNVNKFRSPGIPYHPEGSGLGYLISLPDGLVVYHAGDTDFIPDMGEFNEVFGKIDVAFLPVSGTYVMTPEEAAKAVEVLKPELSIPMHYGKIVGSRNNAEKFRELAMENTQVEILI